MTGNILRAIEPRSTLRKATLLEAGSLSQRTQSKTIGVNVGEGVNVLVGGDVFVGCGVLVDVGTSVFVGVRVTVGVRVVVGDGVMRAPS